MAEFRISEIIETPAEPFDFSSCFISLIDRDSERLIETVVNAVRASGNRLILLSGWGGYQAAQSEDVFVIERVPHDEAMRERVATVGAAIRAEDGVGKAVQIIEAVLQGRQ